MSVDRPRPAHPLCGANLWTLLTLLVRNGPPSLERLPQTGVVLLAALARWPFTAIEHLAFLGLRRGMPPMPPPVFIVGHWRSGTTHLYNVLSRAAEFGYVSPIASGLPWDLLGLARLLRPLLERALPKHRFVDRVSVEPDSPQEDEIALANMCPISFYHGWYFPRNLTVNFNRGVFFDHCSRQEVALWRRRHVDFLQKIAMLQAGKRLLIKNPAYTARVALLRSIWSDAKFIHIHRNPYHVYESTRNLYITLLREFALQSSVHVVIDDFIIVTYKRMMEQLLVDTADLPAGDFAEIRFEDFEKRPVAELERVYATLGLDGFAAARPCFEAYLTTVQGYRKNDSSLSPQGVARVSTSWKAFLKRWDYAVPAPDAAVAWRPRTE